SKLLNAPGFLYVIKDGGNTVQYSPNRGSNWYHVNSGLENTSTSCIVRNTGGELFCGTKHRGIYKANESLISVSHISANIPKEFKLFNNFPNPFNPSTMIKFDVPFESRVSVVIYDLTGKEIEKLTDQYYKPGQHQISWNGSEFSSGVYIVTLYSEQNTLSKKIVLLK
ncbi:MAG TPA: T9SS type A sorting domain-containing protein, partial [Ignavibacteria bacterium]|nr:T9SS type A sorting domain-containing protein [Ignavibacteria bacterium]